MSNRSIEIEKGNPGYAVLNPNTSKIYITYESHDLILVVNINKGVIESKISADRPGDIDINPITNKVHVSAAYGIYEIDGSTNECKLINSRPQTSSQHLQCIQDSPSSLKDHLFAVDSTTNKIYVSKQENESISVYNGNKSNRLEDSINFKAKWDTGTSTRPSFVLVNEDLRLLYVKAYASGSAGGGGGGGELLLVIDLNTKKTINTRSLPSTNTQLGFAFNRSNNTIFMKKISEKAILKYDGYLKKVLHKTTFDKDSVWKKMFRDDTHFAEVIVINPITNKVYLSDSKSKLLYEIDG